MVSVTFRAMGTTSTPSSRDTTRTETALTIAASREKGTVRAQPRVVVIRHRKTATPAIIARMMMVTAVRAAAMRETMARRMIAELRKREEAWAAVGFPLPH